MNLLPPVAPCSLGYSISSAGFRGPFMGAGELAALASDPNILDLYAVHPDIIAPKRAATKPAATATSASTAVSPVGSASKGFVAITASNTPDTAANGLAPALSAAAAAAGTTVALQTAAVGSTNGQYSWSMMLNYGWFILVSAVIFLCVIQFARKESEAAVASHSCATVAQPL